MFNLKEEAGKWLCRHGYHDEKLCDPTNVCSGSYCSRKGCEWKKPSTERPNPSSCAMQGGTFIMSTPAKVPQGCIDAINLIRGFNPEDLKMYILIRGDTPPDIVPLIATHTIMSTYEKFRYHFFTKEWFETELRKIVICKANPKQFEKAKEYGEWVALTEVHHQELGELGLGFSVEKEYPKFLKYLPLYKIE